MDEFVVKLKNLLDLPEPLDAIRAWVYELSPEPVAEEEQEVEAVSEPVAVVEQVEEVVVPEPVAVVEQETAPTPAPIRPTILPGVPTPVRPYKLRFGIRNRM